MYAGPSALSKTAHMPLTLLIDRDDDTRRMYAQFLRSIPTEIEEAEDGREALAKAITRHPDIVVTETRLPGIDGYELCKVLRSDASTHDIPIIFVTGDAFDAEIKRAETSGADSVLVKPCLPETLLFEMRRLLQQSADLRESSRLSRERARLEVERSAELLARSTRHTRRLTLSRAHVREQTSTPANAPPTIVCPVCDSPLTYTHSHIGGVNARASEQWDYYECRSGCGTFQYRQRTRKIRRVA